jgi:hypothetical protein
MTDALDKNTYRTAHTIHYVGTPSPQVRWQRKGQAWNLFTSTKLDEYCVEYSGLLELYMHLTGSN